MVSLQAVLDDKFSFEYDGTQPLIFITLEYDGTLVRFPIMILKPAPPT